TVVVTAFKGDIQAVKTLYIRYNDVGAGQPNLYNLLPANNTTVATSSVTVSGTVAVPATKSLKINGSAVSFNTSGNFNKTLTLSSGVNAIEFKAYAADGVTNTTKTINITYSQDPIIVVTSPTVPDIVYRDSVTIQGKVFNTSTNRFFINGEKVSFSTSDGSFTKTIKLINLRNSIELQAYNESRLTTKNLTFWYNGNPAVTVTSHIYGQRVDAAYVVIEGTIFPGRQSEIATFTINGVNNISTVVNGTFRSVPVVIQPGDNNIVISLTTLAQLTTNGDTISAKTFPKTIKLTSPGTPDINISSPLEGSTVYSNIVPIRGRLENADFSTLTIDGETVEINSNGSFVQNVEVTSGENEIDLVATPVSGTVINKTLTFYYNPINREGAEIRTVVNDGGAVTAFNDQIAVKLAQGSLGLDSTSVISLANLSDIDDPPKQSAFIGPVFDIEWQGSHPVKPYKITLKYDTVVRENQAHKVTVLFYDESEDEWSILGGIVNAKSRTISVESNRAGYFAAAMYFRTFADVVNHWACRDIEYLVARGAVIGSSDDKFKPDNYITRAEFITFIVNALGIEKYEPERPSYRDVDNDHWAYTSIEAALRAGLVTGISHNRFGPERLISREEAGTLLARAGNLKTLKEQEVTKIFSDFNDAGKISSWARNELASAIKSKILTGTGQGVFSPETYTTRAQTAAMIARLMELMNKSKGTSK
ncbi:MAG: S-layer homology domain-containing protein, partial [Eubacteriales bacterium]